MTPFNFLYILGSMVLPLVLVLLLIHQLFNKMLRFSPICSALLSLPFCAGMLLVTVIYNSPLIPWDNTLFFSVSMQILAYGLVCVLYDVPSTIHLFGYFLVKGFLDNTFLIAKLLQSTAIHKLCSGDTALSFTISYLLTLSFTLPMMLWLIRKYLAKLIRNTPHQFFWKFLCFIPISHYLVYTLAISPAYQYPDQICRDNGALLPIIWVCSNSITCYLLARMLDQIQEDSLEIHNLETEALALTMQQKFYNELGLQYEELRRNRHDIHHHLLILQSYLKSNDLAKLDHYLEDCLKEQPNSMISICAVPSVNALASHYYALAQKNGVKISFSLELPKELPLPEKDFVVLFGNLLENAWEACARQTSEKKYIQASASYTGASMIFLTIENSYEGSIEVLSGIYLSSKRKGAGIGLSSARNVAERYRGQLHISHQNGVFRVSVFLNP